MSSRSFLPLLGSLALLVLASVTCPADVPPAAERAGSTEVQSLIAQLGDARFAIRKSASEKLAKIGLPAYAALEGATREGDREIRYRAEKVLSLIRQNDLNRRLTIFLASLDTPEDRTLPCWSRFKATYGNSSASRTLFVEMQRAEGELLALLESEPRQATEHLARRAVEAGEQQDRAIRDGSAVQLSFGQIAALFFVAGEADVKALPQTEAMILRLGNQPTLRDALYPDKLDKQQAERAEMTKKLLAAVILRGDDVAAYPAMVLAAQYELKEGLTPALKLLETPGRSRIPLQYAMALVATFGDDSHLAVLEKLFTDNTLIGTTVQSRSRREIQVRDSALAAAVIMTKQDLKDYFLLPEITPAGRSLSPASLSLGFENEDQRIVAFQKWEAFKANRKPGEPNKPAEPPKPAEAPAPRDK